MAEFSVVSVPANADALIMERGYLSVEDQVVLALQNIALIAAKHETGPTTCMPEPDAVNIGAVNIGAVNIGAVNIEAAKQARMRRAAAKVKAAF